MSDLKWADVAHMYTKNEPCIILEIEGVGKRELLWQQGTRGVMYATSAHALHSRWSQHKPILRHLEDMTEAEAIELYEVAWGFPMELQTSVWDSARDWFHSLWGKYTPKTTVWLYKNGFDIHGLIESGEAIRAEKPGDGGKT